MSVKLTVFPELILPGQGLLFRVMNPTDKVQDVTVDLISDGTTIVSIAISGLNPGEAKDVVVTEDVLGLSNYVGKTIAVVPALSDTTALLLGSSQTVQEKGNAVALKVSGTVTITVVDQYGNPVPYPHVTLYDQRTGAIYTYVGDKDGLVKIPDRLTDNYGQWLVEAIAYDYSRGLVGYTLEKDFDFTNKQLTVTWARNHYVELQLSAPSTESQLEDALKNAIQWIPEPLRTAITAVANALGWTHNTVVNAILGRLVYQQASKYGVNVTSVKYEADRIKIAANIGFGSFLGLLPTIVRWLLFIIGSVIIGWVIEKIVVPFSPGKVAEEQTKQAQIYNDIITKIKEQKDAGTITEDTYNEAVKNVSEVFNYERNSLPPTMPDYGLMALIGLVLMVGVIIALIKAFKS